MQCGGRHRAPPLFKISGSAPGLNNLNHKDALILCHINRCSVSKNVEELENLLDKTKIDFDIVGIS